MVFNCTGYAHIPVWVSSMGMGWYSFHPISSCTVGRYIGWSGVIEMNPDRAKCTLLQWPRPWLQSTVPIVSSALGRKSTQTSQFDLGSCLVFSRLPLQVTSQKQTSNMDDGFPFMGHPAAFDLELSLSHFWNVHSVGLTRHILSRVGSKAASHYPPCGIV